MTTVIYDDRLDTFQLKSRLREDFTGKPPNSQKLYWHLRNGKIPAQKERGIYLIRPEDVPAIAAAFGMKPRAEPEADRPAA